MVVIKSSFLSTAMFQVGNFGIFWIAFFLTQLTAIGVAFTFGTLCPTIDFANGASISVIKAIIFTS